MMENQAKNNNKVSLTEATIFTGKSKSTILKLKREKFLTFTRDKKSKKIFFDREELLKIIIDKYGEPSIPESKGYVPREKKKIPQSMAIDFVNLKITIENLRDFFEKYPSTLQPIEYFKTKTTYFSLKKKTVYIYEKFIPEGAPENAILLSESIEFFQEFQKYFREHFFEKLATEGKLETNILTAGLHIISNDFSAIPNLIEVENSFFPKIEYGVPGCFDDQITWEIVEKGIMKKELPLEKVKKCKKCGKYYFCIRKDTSLFCSEKCRLELKDTKETVKKRKREHITKKRIDEGYEK